MDKLKQASDEAMTRDELVSSASTQKQRNAFSELMAPKPKRAKPSPAERPQAPHLDRFRDNLGVYIDNPASFPASQVIYYDDDFVAIHDLYPKATVHALLLPRSPQHCLLHPFEAFEDADFLASVQKAVRKLEALVAKELQRKLGHESKADTRREAVLNGHVEVDGDELPPGRNWALEVRTGIHAHPSMNHLHIHVFSRDMHSKCVKHRKHYNSFNTPFLVDVADFPLAKDDPRRHPGHEGYLKKDFICWRCHKSYKNQFQQLKAHLEMEFDEWKRE